MAWKHPVTGPALCTGSNRAATDLRAYVDPLTLREVTRGRCRSCRRDLVVDRAGRTFNHFPTPRPVRTRARRDE